MKKIARIFATLLSVAVISSSFAACKDDFRLLRDAEEVKQIREAKKLTAQLKENMAATAITINDDITVSGAYYGFFYSSEFSAAYSELASQAEAEAAANSSADSSADSSAEPEINVDKEAVKNAAIESIIEIKTAYTKAVEAGVTLTDADRNAISEQVTSYMNNIMGQGISYADYLTASGTNAETVEQIFTEQYMGNYYYATLVADKYVTAKHILIMFSEEASADSAAAEGTHTKADAKAMIDEIKAELDNGADFDTIMNEKGEDPGVETNPNGYTFAANEMDPAFESAAFALEPGKTSAIIETSYGYHIIKRLETDTTAIPAALNQCRDLEVSEIINAETEALKEAATVTENAEIIEFYNTLFK
ncbi:MAG: peptidylprolyl isomerase [Clostridia bacterium]|nr:peptidylprolyl isomerase [Clostridia bacterium]